MVQISNRVSLSIPDYCPKCGYKLYHVNALDTKAKIYMVWCPDSTCRYCVEYEKNDNGEIKKCL